MRGIVVVAALFGAAIAVSASSATAQQSSPPTGVSWQSAGDSYSSGEGVFGNRGACAQSEDAYGPRTADALASAGWEITNLTFTACTGHLAGDYFVARDGSSLWNWSLEQGGPPRVDVITMSFGGNDIGFGDLITDCLDIPLVGEDWGAIPPRSGCDFAETEVQDRINNLLDPQHLGCTGTRSSGSAGYDCDLDFGDRRGSIIDFYTKIVEERLTDRGLLYVVGYPRLIAPVEQWPGWIKVDCQGVLRGDSEKLGRLAEYLNNSLKIAVDNANNRLGDQRVVYIDTYELYANGKHELCGTDEDWLNGLSIDRGEGINARIGGSFHPNAAGHVATARTLAARVGETFPAIELPARGIYKVRSIDLDRRTITVRPWTATSDGVGGEPTGAEFTAPLAAGFTAHRVITGETAPLDILSAFFNSRTVTSRPEVVDLFADGGTFSHMSPNYDPGTGEGIDYDYCHLVDYNGFPDGELGDCSPAPGEGINLVQEHLNLLGYGPLVVDGVAGQMTADAVSAFQADRGLEVTGRAVSVLYAIAAGARERAAQVDREPLVATLCGRDLEARPSWMAVNCEGTIHLEGVVWAEWAADEASGTGLYFYGCGTVCGEPEVTPVPVQIRLSSAQRFQCGDAPVADQVFHILEFRPRGDGGATWERWDVGEFVYC